MSAADEAMARIEAFVADWESGLPPGRSAPIYGLAYGGDAIHWLDASDLRALLAEIADLRAQNEHLQQEAAGLQQQVIAAVRGARMNARGWR